MKPHIFKKPKKIHVITMHSRLPGVIDLARHAEVPRLGGHEGRGSQKLQEAAVLAPKLLQLPQYPRCQPLLQLRLHGRQRGQQVVSARQPTLARSRPTGHERPFLASILGSAAKDHVWCMRDCICWFWPCTLCASLKPVIMPPCDTVCACPAVSRSLTACISLQAQQRRPRNHSL